MLLPPRTRRLDTAVDPADAFVTLFGDGDRDAVWLDGGVGAESGRSFLGTGARVISASVAAGTVTDDSGTSEGTILERLREHLETGGDTSGFPLGWTGWLGYEAGAATLGVPFHAGAGADAAFLFIDRLIAFDHVDGTVTVVDATDDGDWLASTAAALETAAGTADAYEQAHPIGSSEAAAQVAWRHDDAAYLGMIAACQEAIRAGDAYQLCLTNTATARTDADPLAVHLRLRRASPSHHAGFLRIAGETLVSSSPEQFLLVSSGGAVRTKPIKGTRPRGATLADDLRLRAELEASEKERAENVMIVDLMRNDLGRVSVTGSVGVRHLLEVESYAQVHQLVSTVEGRLLPGLTAVDALAAAFPAGSMTGAPKLSAMRILDGLESGPRGIYAGCFGVLAADGSADLAVVIRSLRFRGGTVTIGAGGGITALSVPEDELDEVRVKADALLRAAGLRPPGPLPGNGSHGANV
ncbi:aminodeoxychorismate synthase component I [Leifsonia shinshuensis]|uniref:aminodeoxychorismate synthase component I n=1 Tax=Leifsonia shinshuensis TaxID=150026 RepID=UPI001F50D9CB|nr:aminodeoxychorismate synthase component I [Leifsonia shinshuensis]MCI0155507.1 aminodeoxychorismate synthase component I [Leifsonia shinshuensis]